MIKVVCVFGTRPEAIKMAPVVAELKKRKESFDCRVCVTAQHRQMLDHVLRLFDIRSDVDLDIMVKGQTPSYVTAAVHTKLDPVLEEEGPDWVLVQGDTTTAMAASLAAFFKRIRVGHIEAGLRTGHKWQPFPEEVNRRIADLVSDLHFAPTEIAKQNLIREGIEEVDVLVTGNTVIDALLAVVAQPFDPQGTPVESLDLDDRRVILLTAHRRESFGEPLERICSAVREIALRYPDVLIVYPVHPNPNVIEPVRSSLAGIENIALVDPLDYQTLANLMKRSYLILTDSGGIQEEAPSLGVPVLVLRQVTERPEGIEAGSARLVGTNSEAIVAATVRLLDNPNEHELMARVINPYGDGLASLRIVQALLDRS